MDMDTRLEWAEGEMKWLLSGSVSDPDSDWIRIQIGAWIRIRIRNPDPARES